jgi:predicted HTH transcriptional regulator
MENRRSKRIEFVDYPEDAVREALVNALVHWDYNIIGSEIHIDIFDDRMEITNNKKSPRVIGDDQVFDLFGV